MRNLYSKTVIYDYTSKAEAEKDIQKMKKKGYKPIPRKIDGNIIYETGYSYQVEYFKINPKAGVPFIIED